MDLTTFTKLITTLEAHNRKVHEAYKLGIDLLDFGDDYYAGATQPLLLETFGTEGVDWIEWYLYERDLLTGEVAKAWDKEGNEICQDIPSLYKTITKS